MGDGHYTLSSVLLHSLLHKEQNVKLAAALTPLDSGNNIECVTSNERDKQVRWICAMGRRLHFGINTIGLTIAILDRILCVVLVRSKYLNCVAVASMYLAVKLHEECISDTMDDDNVLDAAHLVSQLGVDYSVSELNRMERSLLRILNWDLMLPSCDRFLQAMLVVIDAPHLAESLVLRENFEVVVSEWQLVSVFRPSVLALSLLSLMLQMTSAEWLRITQSLKDIFKIDDLQFVKCRSQMSDVLKHHHSRGKENNSPSSLKALVSKCISNAMQHKSRKRSRAYLDEDGSSDEEFVNFSQNFPAGKEEEEDDGDLHRDVIEVLYNIINAQRD